ncbi:MAG: Phosphoesterase PA-phosphatase related protein [Candidatus Daviesbacteria bacterium GW2011_GWA1_41_61]|nr:MAG: Phosphoesterase PA-phosphatase related protein [Candidatus Daviesbacteria bacterium GW2011_GWB1_41_15]KKS15717.1 MAG: Phosphoesterase PA-phosphatase related protein [Candidatus Daviesbacteria bacterium GW2011_GWA1_41_61]
MKHRLFIFLLFSLYIFTVTVLMVFQGIAISPERYAFVLLLGSLLVKKTRNFIFDWTPFLFILISYDFLRELAGNLNSGTHYLEAINFDQKLFQTLPTVTLQEKFFNTSQVVWYDYGAAFLYLLHFILPLGFGFLLWINNRRYFKEFVTGISLLSYSALVTYLLFPAAPPWMAQRDGYIVGVTKILDQVLEVFSTNLDLVTVYHNLNPNPVGAIPSVHTAWPLLIFLFAYRYFKTKALYFLPYVLSVWLAIIYLGEHYVLDVLTGIIYAIVFYVISVEIMHRINWGHLFRQIENKLFNKKLLKTARDDQAL